MSINFPVPTQVGQLFTDPVTGYEYVCERLGPPAQWTSSGNAVSLDDSYLRLDTANDPLTGNLGIGGSQASPNITLAADGKITAAGNGTFGDYSATAGARVASSGSIVSRKEVSGSRLQVAIGNEVNSTGYAFSINPVNSAALVNVTEWDGSIKIGGDIVADAPNIALKADGTASFAAGNGVAIDANGRLIVGAANASGYASSGLLVQANGNDSTGSGNLVLKAGTATTSLGADAEIGTIKFGDLTGLPYAGIVGQADGTPSSGNSPGSLIFSTVPSGTQVTQNRMMIRESGNVLIGGTLPESPMIELSAGGTVTATGYLYFNYGETTQTFLGRNGSNSFWQAETAGTIQIRCGTSGSSGVQLSSNGTSWTGISDETMKRNLEPIEDGLAKVNTLRAVTGQFIDDDQVHPFLISQDVQKVLPEAVTEDNETGKLLLSYTETIPLLVAALKEATTRIEDLEASNAALAARLDAAGV